MASAHNDSFCFLDCIEADPIEPKEVAAAAPDAQGLALGTNELEQQDCFTPEQSEDDAFNSDQEHSPSAKHGVSSEDECILMKGEDDTFSSQDLPTSGNLAENVKVKRFQRLRTRQGEAESKDDGEGMPPSKIKGRGKGLEGSAGDNWKHVESKQRGARAGQRKNGQGSDAQAWAGSFGCTPYRSNNSDTTWWDRGSWNENQWSSNAWQSYGWQASGRNYSDVEGAGRSWNKGTRSQDGHGGNKENHVPSELAKAVLSALKGAWHDKSHTAAEGLPKSYEITIDKEPRFSCRTWSGDVPSEVESVQPCMFENGDIFLGKEKRMYLDVVSELYATWVDEKDPSQKVFWTRGWAEQSASVKKQQQQKNAPVSNPYVILTREDAIRAQPFDFDAAMMQFQ